MNWDALRLFHISKPLTGHILRFDGIAFVNAALGFTPPALSGTATWNPGSIGGGGREVQDVTVTGAAVGDLALCTHSALTGSNDPLRCLAHVRATNTCEAMLHNTSTGTAVNLDSGTVTCLVFKV